MLSTIKNIAKAVLRTRLFAAILAVIFWKRAKLLFGERRKGAMIVLAFSSVRWRQDLKALAEANNVAIYAIDDDLVFRINALFQSPGKRPNRHYYLETDREILDGRRRCVDYLTVFGRILKIISGADCAVTAAIHYKHEQAWAEAFDRINLPFVAVHKESTVIDDRHLPERIKILVDQAQKFNGSAVCVCSERTKRLFSEGGVIDPSRLHVTGLLRLDNLMRDVPEADAFNGMERNVVTLFSFGHFSGGISNAESRSHYFSARDHVGFVELFRDVHVGFAETALKHPTLKFFYKTKPGEGWAEEIRAIVEKELGRPFDSITNLEIANSWTPAPSLMRQSRFVVGLNSTVLIEARILGVPTVMPYFAEAQTKYPYNVYFHQFHDVFATPRSKPEFLDCLERGIAGEPLHPECRQRVSEMLREYVGFDDGRTAERVFDVLRKLTGFSGSRQIDATVAKTGAVGSAVHVD